MGVVLNLLLSIGFIVAFFWSLDALRTLKDGQAEILRRLDDLESLQQQGAAPVIPDDEQFGRNVLLS